MNDVPNSTMINWVNSFMEKTLESSQLSEWRVFKSMLESDRSFNYVGSIESYLSTLHGKSDNIRNSRKASYNRVNPPSRTELPKTELKLDFQETSFPNHRSSSFRFEERSNSQSKLTQPIQNLTANSIERPKIPNLPSFPPNSNKIEEIAQRAYNVFMFNTRDMEKNLGSQTTITSNFDLNKAFQWCE